MARRPGMKVATKATNNRKSGLEINAMGSCVPSPNIMLDSTLALLVEEGFFKSQEASFSAIGSRKPGGRVTAQRAEI